MAPHVVGGIWARDVVHAFGFSAHGFELGPTGGQIVAELVTEGRSTLPIEAFAVDRLACATAPSFFQPTPSLQEGNQP